jgi:hypothetical protein
VIEILAQISAPEPKPFTAGLVLWDDVVVEAAPIIGYMQRGRWSRMRVRNYCHDKGWVISVVHQMRRPDHVK